MTTFILFLFCTILFGGGLSFIYFVERPHEPMSAFRRERTPVVGVDDEKASEEATVKTEINRLAAWNYAIGATLDVEHLTELAKKPLKSKEYENWRETLLSAAAKPARVDPRRQTETPKSLIISWSPNPTRKHDPRRNLLTKH